MILEELVVHDFGVFAGRHALDLRPRAGRPLIVVGGLNGTGKTTLLEALTLALFGKHAALASRKSGGSYEEFLGRSIHRRADPSQGAAVEVTFTARRDALDEHLRVRRCWTKRGARIRERLDVVRNGKRDPVLSDQWDEHVESFVPRGLAPLFFFDGEQLEAFADVENSQSLLATAVGALLGLDLIDRLVDDLGVLERRRRLEQSKASTRAEVERLEQEIGKLHREEHRRVEDLTVAQARLAKAERRFRQLDERFRAEGGELYEEADSLGTRRAEVAAQANGLRERLRELAAGAAPLTLVRAAVDRLARDTPDLVRSPQVAAFLEDRDRRLAEHLRSAGADPHVIRLVSEFAAENGPLEAASQPTVDGTAVSDARRLGDTLLPEAVEAIRAIRSDLAWAQDELDTLDRKLAAVPEPDALRGLLDKRAEIAAEREDAERAFAETKEGVNAVRRDITRRRSEEDRVLEATAQEALAEEDSLRIVAASQRARVTAERFRLAATTRHVGRIERLVLDSLDLLLRKDRLVAELRIDPADFRVTLFGGDSRELQPHQLSAGERQLLATSMLWGLARASARPLPVVIDTPLGRLDSIHRAHLLDRYFPHASHQVVLLSTDEEIDADAWQRLKRRTARAYRLAFDEAADGSVVQTGYFFEEQRAS